MTPKVLFVFAAAAISLSLDAVGSDTHSCISEP